MPSKERNCICTLFDKNITELDVERVKYSVVGSGYGVVSSRNDSAKGKHQIILYLLVKYNINQKRLKTYFSLQLLCFSLKLFGKECCKNNGVPVRCMGLCMPGDFNQDLQENFPFNDSMWNFPFNDSMCHEPDTFNKIVKCKSQTGSRIGNIIFIFTLCKQNFKFIECSVNVWSLFIHGKFS